MTMKRLSGNCSAMGIRFPPEAQPSSSTRQFAGEAGLSSEQPGDRGEAVGVGLAEGVAFVGGAVVGGLLRGIVHGGDVCFTLGSGES